MKLKSNRNLLSQLGALMLLTTLSACVVVTVPGPSTGGGGYGGGGGGSGGGYSYVDPYQHAWYDVYGNMCTTNGYPMSGCNFYSNGQKISSAGDPYYASLTLYFDYWTYTDSYGYRRQYQGYAWLSNTGILYDGQGNALNEMDQDAVDSNDILSLASAGEEAMAKSVGKQLSQKYALAESSGISIAKTLQDWAVLGRDRSRTNQDVAAFSKRLYGVDAEKAAAAMAKAMAGNTSALSDLNVDVAAHWGTSPETSKQILKSWYADELSSIGM